jgi:hypothetical protein
MKKKIKHKPRKPYFSNNPFLDVENTNYHNQKNVQETGADWIDKILELRKSYDGKCRSSRRPTYPY